MKFLSFNDLPKSKRASPEVELGSDSCELRGPFGLGLSNKIYVELCNISLILILLLILLKYLTRLCSSFQKTPRTRECWERAKQQQPLPLLLFLLGSLWRLLLICLIHSIPGEPLRYIGNWSYNRKVPEGASVDLSCELSDPNVRVTLWQVLGNGGMFTPRKNVAYYGQVFTIHRATKKTEGTYLCRARQPRFVKNIGRIFVTQSPKGNEKGLCSSFACILDVLVQEILVVSKQVFFSVITDSSILPTFLSNCPFRPSSTKCWSKTKDHTCQSRCKPYVQSYRDENLICAVAQKDAKTFHATPSGQERVKHQRRNVDKHPRVKECSDESGRVVWVPRVWNWTGLRVLVFPWKADSAR